MIVSSRSKRWSKIPTREDIAAFNGLHCARMYQWALKHGWRCPCCARSPTELIRWSEIRGQYFRKHYADEHGMGWTISLTWHHCHSVDEFNNAGRFPKTLICGDCNSADGATKRKLGLPTTFSFRPDEIARFVTGTPHRPVAIDYAKAADIFTDLALSARSAP